MGTVTNDDLVHKHQAISIHCADSAAKPLPEPMRDQFSTACMQG